MDYKELIKKNNFHICCHMAFSKYSEERMNEFRKKSDDAKIELESLGDNLTKDDYEKVKELYTILEQNLCAESSMSVVNMSKEERYEILVRLAKEFQEKK